MKLLKKPFVRNWKHIYLRLKIWSTIKDFTFNTGTLDNGIIINKDGTMGRRCNLLGRELSIDIDSLVVWSCYNS